MCSQSRLWQCHHGVRHVPLYFWSFSFNSSFFQMTDVHTKKQSGLSFCVHALQQWHPFRFGLFPVSMLVSYRASSIPDPLQLFASGFFYRLRQSEWTYEPNCNDSSMYIPRPAMWSSWCFGWDRSTLGLVDSWDSTFQPYLDFARGFPAKGPDSSVGGVLVGYCPDDIHMVERSTGQGSGRRRGDRRNTRKGTRWGIRRENTTKSHTWMTTRMRWNTHQHLSHAVWCANNDCVSTAWEKKWRMRCTVYTTPVGYSRLPSSCKRNQLQQTIFYKMNWTHELHQLLDVSQFHHESLEEEACHLWYCWKGTGSARSSPDSRWRTVHDCDCGSEVWSKSHRCIPARFVFMWDTDVFWYLWNSSLDRTVGMVFLCQLVHFRCTSARSSQFWVANHEKLGLVEKRSWIPS